MKIGCLHAHHSNITYIEQAAFSKVELIHFVDPGLMNRISNDKSFDLGKAKHKVIEQIEWIAQSGVDVILITCTNYITLLEEEHLQTSIPIIKIDEPFFSHLCKITQPQILLFTNPATVEGTMNRLKQFAAWQNQPVPDIEVLVIGNSFELLMQGDKEQYSDVIADYIRAHLESNPDTKISVAQLSMVEAAERIAQELQVTIGNPLAPLIDFFLGEDIYYTGKHLHVGDWDRDKEGIAWERVDGTMDLFYVDPNVEDFRGVFICNVKSNEEAEEQFMKWAESTGG
jgi:hypothetical protein